MTFSKGIVLLPFPLHYSLLKRRHLSSRNIPSILDFPPLCGASGKAHISETVYLGRSVTLLFSGAFPKQVNISDKLLHSFSVDLAPYLAASLCFLPVQIQLPHNKWTVCLTWTIGVWSKCWSDEVRLLALQVKLLCKSPITFISHSKQCNDAPAHFVRIPHDHSEAYTMETLCSIASFI